MASFDIALWLHLYCVCVRNKRPLRQLTLFSPLIALARQWLNLRLPESITHRFISKCLLWFLLQSDLSNLNFVSELWRFWLNRSKYCAGTWTYDVFSSSYLVFLISPTPSFIPPVLTSHYSMGDVQGEKQQHHLCDSVSCWCCEFATDHLCDRVQNQ